jgi:hypothetical protein
MAVDGLKHDGAMNQSMILWQDPILHVSGSYAKNWKIYPADFRAAEPSGF